MARKLSTSKALIYKELCVIRDAPFPYAATLPRPSPGVRKGWLGLLTGRLRRHHQIAAAGAVRPD